MKIITIDNFSFEIPEDAEVVGLIGENKERYTIHIKPSNKIHDVLFEFVGKQGEGESKSPSSED